jgi:hypothetical protein
MEYDEYLDQENDEEDHEDPFSDPERVEHDSLYDDHDQASPGIGGLYTSDAGSGRGKRSNNAGYAPLYESNDANEDIDLETGGFSQHDHGRR